MISPLLFSFHVWYGSNETQSWPKKSSTSDKKSFSILDFYYFVYLISQQIVFKLNTIDIELIGYLNLRNLLNLKSFRI